MALQSGGGCWGALLQATIAGSGGRNSSKDWPWDTVCPETTVVKETAEVSGVQPLKCELKCSFVPCCLLLARFGASCSTVCFESALCYLHLEHCVLWGPFHRPEGWQPASSRVGQCASVIRGYCSSFTSPPTSLLYPDTLDNWALSN